MSSEDQVRPYHAKDEARGQEAAEALAAVLKHAAEKDRATHDKPPRKKQPKWMLPLGINLGVLAVYLLIAPPSWVVVNPVQGPDMAVQTDMMAAAIYMQYQAIESYQIQNGRLPATLAESGRVYEGIDYVRQGDQYQLIALVGETPVVWDSTRSNEEIRAAAGRRFGGIS
jgi:hypothetical protein